MYEVLLESRAQRDLKGLPAETFHRIVNNIASPGNDPRPDGCTKIRGSMSDWRIRIGKYRVIYEIDDELKQVRIMRVRKRSEAYR
jgi:mRNA interferase RelE/StbE